MTETPESEVIPDGMDRITDQLYISSAPSARRLPEDHPFDRVITVGYFDRLGYERPEATTDEHVFPDGDHDYTQFKCATDTALAALADGQRVLVHCQAGVSRSAAVCSAVLAVQMEIPLEKAYARIHNVRPKVDPVPEVWASAERYVEDRHK
ncbi:dual specificity protein phosphatase family protein [Salinigranum halophilum]|uniref:dual specificity protein phosphatase family protein n=1 Tax=Salinigranum halophilum TaxID=2565931 RepID=UPI00115C5938|nr:dual specificity protein phosphatase [Salinigranum halophilum]